jgi:hypothetical protein
MRPGVEWYDLVFELIDMRSFSNLWYWIALAVFWSSLSHFVLGVPFDMLVRARRRGGEAERDFEDMVRISVGRILGTVDRAGHVLAGLAAFALSVLATLGFWYRVEFAQAVFLLCAPLVPVAWVTVRAARRVRSSGERGEALRRRIQKARVWVQVIGMVSIFITAMWGMYQNVTIGVFGGWR